MPSEDGGRSERAGSVASSHTEAGGHEDVTEKHAFVRDDESLSTLKSPTAYQDSLHDEDHLEDEELLPQEMEKKPEPPKASAASGMVWIVVNTLATVGIVGAQKVHSGRS